MDTVDKAKALELGIQYLSNSLNTPFFITIDGECKDLQEELAVRLKTVYTSDFCSDHSFPDYDELTYHLKNVTENTLLLGVGEAMVFQSDASYLGKLKDLALNKKVIVLLRGLKKEALALNRLDPKFNHRRFCLTEGDGTFKVIQYASGLSAQADNFRQLLRYFEESSALEGNVKTDLSLPFAKKIQHPYELIQLELGDFSVPESILTAIEWGEYQEDRNLDDYDLFHWRRYLSYCITPPKEEYLSLVMSKSSTYEDYKQVVIFAILDISHKESSFTQLYQQRKLLLKEMSTSNTILYVQRTHKNDNNRIFYLTDNSREERCAILESLEKFQVTPKELEYIYPDLFQYLKPYQFSGKHGEELSAYFENYKKCKVQNRITPDFLETVEEFSISRPFLALEKRGQLVESHQKDGTFLYWLDAMGVEYLAFIQELLSQRDLSSSVTIGQSELPTLTVNNSAFYQEWKGLSKNSKELDDVKHNRGGVTYSGKSPDYLAQELDIITRVIDEIQVMLMNEAVEKVVLTSDHGASRLAVLHGVESKWEMSNKGNHSGRCCLKGELDSQPDCATEGFVMKNPHEKEEYWVLANYDRFSGSRRALVEVHGGASLEEVVVPIIEITRKSDALYFEAESGFDQNNVPIIVLYCDSILPEIQIYFNGKFYSGSVLSENQRKHQITFLDFKKPGHYEGDVYVNGNKEGTITFEIKSMLKKNDDFFD